MLSYLMKHFEGEKLVYYIQPWNVAACLWDVILNQQGAALHTWQAFVT